MARSTAGARKAAGLTEQDITELSRQLADGKRPRVQLSGPHFPVGAAGTVVRIGSPEADGPDFVRVRVKVNGMTDELAFAPAELSLRRAARQPAKASPPVAIAASASGRGSAKPRAAGSARTSQTQAAPAATAAAPTAPAATDSAATDSAATASATTASAPGSADMAPTMPPPSPQPDVRPEPAAKPRRSRSVPADTPTAPAGTIAPAKASVAKAAAARAEPAKAAAARAEPARAAGRRRKGGTPAVTFTISSVGASWTLTGSRGNKSLMRNVPVPPGAVSAVAELLDQPALTDAVSEINDAALAEARARAEQLRAELDELEAVLATHRRP